MKRPQSHFRQKCNFGPSVTPQSPGAEPVCIGLASDDVTKLSNAWQRVKLVLNKDSAPYKSMLGEKSLTGRSSIFLPGEVRTVLTTSSQLSASHFKRSWGSEKRWAVFRSIDDLPACFCMGRYLCLEPILPVATPVAALWRSTCKPYWTSFESPLTRERCNVQQQRLIVFGWSCAVSTDSHSSIHSLLVCSQ